MPNYEFYCEACDRTYERRLKMEDRKKPQDCEECGNPLERMLSAPSFQVHGYSYRNGYTRQPEKASKTETSKPKDTSSKEA